MNDHGSSVHDAHALLRRADRGRVLAGLIKIFGDFDLAEESLQDAVVAALESWPSDGYPTTSRAGSRRHPGAKRSIDCAAALHAVAAIAFGASSRLRGLPAIRNCPLLMND